MKTELILGALCLVALAMAWVCFYYEHWAIPAAEATALLRAVECLRADVMMNARRLTENQPPMIRAVCEGGPLDGTEFLQPVDSDIAKWLHPETGAVLGTYAMTFRSYHRGVWVFRHVSPLEFPAKMKGSAA